jgi:hypothetical protein
MAKTISQEESPIEVSVKARPNGSLLITFVSKKGKRMYGLFPLPTNGELGGWWGGVEGSGNFSLASEDAEVFPSKTASFVYALLSS